MFGVDVGGTFTDVIAIVDGVVKVAKVPSVPDNPHLAVLEGARQLNVEASDIFNHASTKGLNAVLTRQLPKIGFLTTDGHRDMLDGGRSWRPFDGQMNPGWRRPFSDVSRPLVPRYLRRGVRERVLASGEVLIPLDEDHAREILALYKRCNIEGLAICCINSYLYPEHEQRLKQIASEVLGDVPITISSEASPRAKEYSRASTTVIDVMMKYVYEDYAHELDQGLKELGFTGELNFADCTASLLPWKDALIHPYRIVFAGPAAAVASTLRLGQALGEQNLICCDVGGTSTDVGLIMDGEPFTNDMFELEFDMVINALSTEVSSVGAGGGSIVSITASGDVRVGPESAGAMPGPACYGRGGVLPTVTDACLLMGILDEGGFADGQLTLDREKAQKAFAALDTPLSMEQRISYAYQLAVNNIAEEVANIAIRHGADPRDFSLLACGAAGPMLLAGALDILQLKRIIIPPYPGLFSALGLLSTDLVYSESQSAYLVLFPDVVDKLNDIYEVMEEKLKSRVPPGQDYVLKRSFDGRLLGQSWETPFVDVPAGKIDAQVLQGVVDNFHQEYLRRNGQAFEEMPVQGVSYRVQLIIHSEKYEYQQSTITETNLPEPISSRELSFLSAEKIQTAVYDRDSLLQGMCIQGPAIIQEALSTILVLPNQQAKVGKFLELQLTRKEEV